LKYVFFGSQLRTKGKKQFHASQDYVPKSLTQPKMAMNSFGNQKYMQPVGRLKHATPTYLSNLPTALPATNPSTSLLLFSAPFPPFSLTSIPCA
jgi:hypothetical protein